MPFSWVPFSLYLFCVSHTPCASQPVAMGWTWSPRGLPLCIRFHSQPCHVSILSISIYHLHLDPQSIEPYLLPANVWFYFAFLVFRSAPNGSLFYISLANVIFGAGELQNIEGGIEKLSLPVYISCSWDILVFGALLQCARSRLSDSPSYST